MKISIITKYAFLSSAMLGMLPLANAKKDETKVRARRNLGLKTKGPIRGNKRSVPLHLNSGHRTLKSPKSKFPKSSILVPEPGYVCPVEDLVPAALYSIRGSTAELTAAETNDVYQGFSEDCAFDAGFEWNSLFKNADSELQLSDYTECVFPKFLTPNKYWDPPIYFINDGNAATYQIVDAADEPGDVEPSPGSINNTMFKGEVACGDSSCSDNKVIIKFQDFTLDDLWEVRINQIDYIEYDFYPISCPGGATECLNHFYMSIYTHEASNDYPLDIPDTLPDNQIDWYNCRYNFNSDTNLVPGSTGSVGEWSTVRIEGSTKPSSIKALGYPDPPGECTADTKVEEISDDNLLGSNYLEPTIFILNMGQSNDSDNGLAGYFDNIRIKLTTEDFVRVYDL